MLALETETYECRVCFEGLKKEGSVCRTCKSLIPPRIKRTCWGVIKEMIENDNLDVRKLKKMGEGIDLFVWEDTCEYDAELFQAKFTSAGLKRAVEGAEAHIEVLSVSDLDDTRAELFINGVRQEAAFYSRPKLAIRISNPKALDKKGGK